MLIKQDDGQGNRMHHHPGADEFWCILSGRLLWEMEGNDGSMRQEVVGGGYLVYIPKGRKHRITALCDGAIRLAITAPDVEHVYDN